MNICSLIRRKYRRMLFPLVITLMLHLSIRFVPLTKTSLNETKFTSSSPVIKPKEANRTASSVCSCKVFTRYRENWLMKNIGCPEDQNTVKAVLRTLGGNIPIYVYPKNMDLWVSGSIIDTGSFESYLFIRVYDIMSKDKSLNFVDIGANVGVYTMSVAKMGRRVLAIEALPQNARKLCKSVQEVKFNQPVPVIVNNVVSDKRSLFGFGFYPVEKHESQVLKGAREFFKKVNVKYILMEMSFATEDDITRADEVMQFLEDQKLKPYWPDNPLTPVSRSTLLNSKRTRDVLWQKIPLKTDA